MRIDRLFIKDFKNLRDFSIDFDEKQLTTVLIGQNGTGKSNLFEALVLIFRSLNLGEPPPFAYSIRYLCRGHTVEIEADPNELPAYRKVVVDGKARRQAAFTRDKGELLPAHVFAYYSGPSQRMERIFDKHQKQFYDALLRGEKETLRPLFYCRLVHSQFVMLVFYAFDDSESARFLRQYLGVTGLDSVLFVLGTPQWARGKRKASHKNADPRFWGSVGTVQRFLDRLWDLSLAPLRRTETVYPDFRSKGEKEERLYLFIRDQTRLRTLAGHFTDLAELKPSLTAHDSDYRQAAVRALGNLGSAADLPDLRAHLNDDDSGVRQAAVEALGKLGSPEDVRRLRVYFNDEAPGVRQAAVEALGKLGSAADLPHLKARLSKDNDPLVWQAAIEAIGRLGSAADLPSLKGYLGKDYDLNVRQATIEAIGRLGSAADLPYLKHCLYEEDSGVHQTAIEAIGKLGSDIDVQDLLPFAKLDPHSVVRRAAVEAIGKLGTATYEYDMRASLRDEDAGVRQAAVEAIGKLGSATDVPALRAHLNDDDAGVRQAAVEAVAKLGSATEVSDLRARLNDEDWGVRQAAAEALSEPGSTAGMPGARQQLPDDGPPTRQPAAQAVREVDRAAHPKRFFADLESTYISDLIREVRIRVNREGVDGFLTFKELSEGEQQLLAVLGLLKFTKQDESLFLLDEPDTHLNPMWKLRYLGLVEQIVGAGQTSQLLLATHDPLTIAGLLASQVQIFERADGAVTVRPPALDPKGLGVSGVLTRLFGLPTTLDEETQGLLDQRNALLAKKQPTLQDQARLREFSDKLANKGFVAESRDPDYEAFLRAKLQWREKRRRTFTQDELEDQERIAKRFLDELLRTGTQR